MEDLVILMKALADESRLRLLELLPKPDEVRCFCVGDLADKLGISQPNVSHHLQVLKMAKLVRCEKNCGSSYYVVNLERLEEVSQQLNGLVK